MISLITQLAIGFLFVGILACLALGWAITHTADGCEDETGFHPDIPPRT